MRGFVFGFIVGLIVIPVGAALYLNLGYAPVATSEAPMPFEKYFAQHALNARIAKEAPRNEPSQPTEAAFLNGAKLYREHCAVCHGLPGQPPTAIATGEFPKPPKLLEGKGVTDDPAGETFWKVKNGIRLTGMPSFGPSLSDEQIWDVAELLAKAGKLPDTVTRALRQ